jgi:hypothetical protein
MAEYNAARLDHRSAIERVDVNRIGDWSQTYAEPPLSTSLPLSVPGGNAPAAPRQIEAPIPPTEEELRERLAVAITAKQTADETLRRAEAAHERAEHHHEKCKRRLALYAGLDETIAEATITALRCSAGVLSPDLNEEQELALADRDHARAELAAAARAVAVLLEERAAASRAAGDAGRVARSAADRVLSIEAERIAERHVELVIQAARLRGVLFAFDRLVTGSGIGIPQSVKQVLGSNATEFLQKRDGGPWTAARDALLTDPMADVEIA